MKLLKPDDDNDDDSSSVTASPSRRKRNQTIQSPKCKKRIKGDGIDKEEEEEEEEKRRISIQSHSTSPSSIHLVPPLFVFHSFIH
jgi:hypothetical protein